VIEVMVIHEVPVIEVTVIELPTGKSGATMEGATGKTTHMTTHATHMAATADRRNSAIISGANNVLEVRRACYRLS
jgi:hypothetical protein